MHSYIAAATLININAWRTDRTRRKKNDNYRVCRYSTSMLTNLCIFDSYVWQFIQFIYMNALYVLHVRVLCVFRSSLIEIDLFSRRFNCHAQHRFITTSKRASLIYMSFNLLRHNIINMKAFNIGHGLDLMWHESQWNSTTSYDGWMDGWW